MRVPWTARRSNQSILKEISPEYSLEGLMLMLKLKLQYFDHLMRRTDSFEKTLMLGKIEGAVAMVMIIKPVQPSRLCYVRHGSHTSCVLTEASSEQS